MRDRSINAALAVRVARMYYDQELTSQQIADELELSRSKVSRLLSYAKEQGFVEIRVVDPNAELQRVEHEIRTRFGVPVVQVVSVPEAMSEHETLDRVARSAAAYLNRLLENGSILAVAWGTTTSAVSERLTPKLLNDVQVVQLNGSGNTHDMGISYSSEILRNFANAYRAQAHPFPVPTFFDYPETKRALWRERSIRRILDLQQRADILLYSIGTVQAGVPSHVYAGGYLEREDLAELEQQRVAGDIATVFFRGDGSHQDIPINARVSGPDLALFRRAKHALCVVSGKGKVTGLHGALKGGYLNSLIVDEPTARLLLTGF
jgi:deoxyribonucleoside regulator